MKPSLKSCKLFPLTYRLILLIGILLFASLANGQRISHFSDELELFPTEIEQIIKDQLKKDEELLIRDFTLFWESDTLSTEKKAKVIDISNHLLKKTVVSPRHFVTLLKILLQYQVSEKFQKEFDTWTEGLLQFAEDERILIAWLTKFIENSHALFTRNTFFINPAFEWKAGNNNFNFQLDNTLTVKFSETDIICTNKTDSITIHSTKGVYYPLEDRFKGEGGKVTWIRSQIPEDEVYATLSTYSINLTRNEYEADSVLFMNMDYFRKPSMGRLKDKIQRSSKPENVVFPEFYTYDQRHSISNLFENVDFDGGYYMTGSQFVGSGTRENPAVIVIRRDNEEFLRVEARTYVFRRQTVVSDYARVRFRIHEDSLFHTGLNFTYNDGLRMVSIAPTDFLTTQSPILSTYHNFSINFGQIRWNIDDDKIVFGAPIGTSLGRAYFESNNFFNEEEFDNLMGRDEQHPLFAVANFTRRLQSRTFNVEDFSRFVRKSVEQTRIVVMRLAMQGFVFYEFETGEVQALPKLYDAIRARGKFIDYDVLRFSSTTEDRPNAVLDINTLEMNISGVNNVSVSDSQNVFIYPARRQLTLKRNRNFEFDGIVRAGLFTFYGNEFNFNYEDFNLQLSSIDSLNLDYQTEDYDLYGRRVLNSVTSTLENITGEILIDKPDNKSGLVNNEEYPIFNSTQNSFVFYDDNFIHNGVYNRENFFFEIYPFTFYNLNNFEYSDMNFIGILYSADIFSPVEDTLILRPDNSLGFRRELPAEGYAIYQGRGQFYQRLDLSNRGLRGMGDVTYITSKTSSDDIYFFPDSMITQSTDFTIARQDRGIQYPEVIGKEHSIKWFPYDEQLLAFRGDRPFSLFHDQALLSGDLTLEPLGLIGNGLIDLRKARLRSNHYDFHAIDFETKEASAEFLEILNNEVAFTSDKLQANVDFDSEKGEFNKVDVSIFADMPQMMYQSHLDQFTWSMKKNELTISTPSQQEAMEMELFYVSNMADKDSIPPGSLFYSLHAQEDSLYFFSPKATFSLRQPNIKADSVRYLIIADAVIQPQEQTIEVDAKQRILPLKSSEIIASYTNKFHRIYDADITIPSRKRYYAKGTVDYVDELDSIQPVALNEIAVDNQGNTFAKTSVTEPDNFRLSQHFGFFGEVELFANEKNWLFNGGAQPIHSCKQIRSSNISFKSFIEPDNIFIPVPERPQNLNKVNLISGSVVTVDSIHLYPSFISGRKEYSDRTLVNSNGYLHYNKNRNRFQLGSMEKINNPDTTGNLISLTKDFCMLFSEGVVNIPVNLGQVKNFSTGNLTHILEDSTLTMDIVLSLDFLFNDDALTAMANDIMTQERLLNVDLNRKIFHRSLFERLDHPDALTAISQINLFGTITQSFKELEGTISFSELRMVWDHSNQSFVSRGKLGIGTIGNRQINKKVDGFIEILKRNTGDWMMIYIELSPDKYYYFYYIRGAMQVSSHNSLFTDPINEMRSRDKRIRVRPGEIPFNFTVGTRRELQRVRNRYNQLIGRDVNDEAKEADESIIEEPKEDNAPTPKDLENQDDSEPIYEDENEVESPTDKQDNT